MFCKTYQYILNVLTSILCLFIMFSDSYALDMKSPKGQAIGAGRAVLVTGASSGIGKQIATNLADQGFYVYAGARKERDINALNQIPNMEGIRLDVTVQSEIDAAVKKIETAGRGLFGLVNNAGVFLFDPLIEASERDMDFIMDVNVMGPYRVTKAFAPLIMERKGRITTIGSVAGLFSGRLFGPYGMSKFAIEAYSEALADEMKKFGVAVSIIEPGNFKSNIMKNMKDRLQELDEGTKQSLYREEVERFASFTQADRSHHLSPKPVADAVYNFMVSDKPQFRYLVTPNQAEADMTIKRSLQKVIKMNQGQPFRMNNEDILDYVKSLLVDSK